MVEQHANDLQAQVQAAIEQAVDAARQDPRINCFDQLITALDRYYAEPVHSMIDLKRKNQTKRKGDLFEVLAKLYFHRLYGLPEVWLLGECPPEIRETLKIAHHDMGIDLIARDAQGRYYAIQAKYRRPNAYKPKQGLSWQCLSTFYALVNRTGPYHRHIIFTNAHYARHVGRKTKNDVSICLARLRSTPLSDWCKLTTWTAHTLGTAVTNTEITPPLTNNTKPSSTLPLVITPAPLAPLPPASSSSTSAPPTLARPVVVITRKTPSLMSVKPPASKPCTDAELREKRLQRFQQVLTAPTESTESTSTTITPAE